MEPQHIPCPSTVIDYWEKGPPFRIVVGITCLLSVVGSLLIIFSYVFFESLRSRARLILVHLSIADLGVSLSNLIGDIIYFDRFYYSSNEVPLYNHTVNNSFPAEDMPCVSFHQPSSIIVRQLCVAQAFIAHYFTQASILWTISLAVFLYFLIVHNTTKLAKHSLTISYLLCYLLPLLVCLWLVLTERFGYSSANTGWCSILFVNPWTNTPDKFVAVFGYDLWVYLGMLLVPILYAAVQLYIREKLRQTKLYLPQAEGKFWEAVHILDYNFLLIPVVFTLLRIWTSIMDIMFVYVRVQYSPLWLNITFVYLSAVGDSAQGAANAVLYVLLTKRVRTTLFSPRYWRLKLHRNKSRDIDNETGPLLSGKRGIYSASTSESDMFTPARASAEESNIFSFSINR